VSSPEQIHAQDVGGSYLHLERYVAEGGLAPLPRLLSIGNRAALSHRVPSITLASAPALDHFAGESPWVAARIGCLRRVKQVGSGGIQMRRGAAPRTLGAGAHFFIEYVSSLGLQLWIAGHANGGAKKQAAP
jgi:hypothetical protein